MYTHIHTYAHIHTYTYMYTYIHNSNSNSKYNSITNLMVSDCNIIRSDETSLPQNKKTQSGIYIYNFFGIKRCDRKVYLLYQQESICASYVIFFYALTCCRSKWSPKLPFSFLDFFLIENIHSIKYTRY